MCFQGYARWRCGHTTLYEQECTHATTLSTPFWLKLSCPNYQISTRSPAALCGTGSFYCAQTPDGFHLNRIYAALKTTQDDIQRFSEHIYGEKGLKVYGEWLGGGILRNGGSKEDCYRDAELLDVFRECKEVGEEIGELRGREGGLRREIENAKGFFEWRARAAGLGQDVAGARLFPPRSASSSSFPSSSQPAVQKPRRLPTLGGAAPSRGGKYLDRRQHTPLNVPTKQRQKIQGTTSPENPPSPPIRRSTRVRTKKIIYAESDSDPFSRSPSPAKSSTPDSSFSPSNPEVPPPDRKPSLVDKISDWQKRELTRTSVTKQEVLPEYLANHYRANREWEVNRGERDAEVPVRNQNVLLPVKQEWNVNRYDVDLTVPPQQVSGIQSKRMDYGTMQQSFFDVKGLVKQPYPSNVLGGRLEQMGQEPRKRQFPAAGSDVDESGPGKRMKLSMPGLGEDAAPILAPTMGLRRGPTAPLPSSSAVGVGEKIEEEGEEDDSGDVEEGSSRRDEEVDDICGVVEMEESEDSELSDIDWSVLEEGVCDG